MASGYRREEDLRRRKREKAKRAREQFIMFVLLLALIPTVLCVILFTKQSKLSREVEDMEKQLRQSQGQENKTGGSPFPTPTLTNTPTPTLTSSPQPTDGTAAGGDGTSVPVGGDDVEPTPTPTPTPTLEPSPTPTLAVDPETGEVLPWADKQVYLTFDDGPSGNTDDLLDLLKEYGVKVTFFVIGKTDDESLRLYKRIVDEGHSLAMHSYSHKYEEIYNSVEDFEKDFTKISDLLYDTIGYVPDLYRFPGGSSNGKCKKLTIQPFIRFLQERDIRYFDWNVENGDATGVNYTVEQLAENLLDGVSKKKSSVVLCHDTNAKTKTLESMKIVIPTLQEKGAQILPITADTPMVRHVLPADE